MHETLEYYRLFWTHNTQVALSYHFAAVLLIGMVTAQCWAERRSANNLALLIEKGLEAK